jgi:signal transduction histidine kinase
LVLRTAIASGVLALVVGAAFAILLVAIDDLRTADRQSAHTREQLSVADGLEKLLIDLETGVRGFVITREERFLEPWQSARGAFPKEAERLAEFTDRPEQLSRLRRITRDANVYIDDYSVPLIDAARRGEASARSVAATEEGKRRVDALRSQFDSFTGAERATLTGREQSVDRDARRAVLAASVGLAGSIVLIVLYGAYLTRAIAIPVRRAAGMAGRLAGGDFAVRMPETGMGEIGELEHAFNRMGGSLEASRDELSRLADEQAALRRVATLVARAFSPTEVFETVTREVGLLSGADLARMERYESDGTVTGMAGWSRDHNVELAVGERFALQGVSIAALVQQTGRPMRVDSFAHATGPIAREAQELGIQSSVGCPIVVGGRLWGVIAASSKDEAPFPAGTESQISEFTELVATAIANAESRAELIASRARVVAAADEARRHVVRDLHDGAQQRLVHTVVTLKLAQRALDQDEGTAEALVGEALDQAQHANSELRELAHGILPSVLMRGGLRAGVDALVARLSLPVSVDVSVERLPSGIEAGGYFVVAEALTNVVKHSHADNAEVKAWVEAGVLHLEVRDDGLGGARPDGEGLIGLGDRLAALDGQLRVESPPGGGTLISATLPLPV